MIHILAIALGGAIGAVSRHSIAMISTQKWPNAVIPYGTLIANALGSFLIGIIAAWALKTPLNPALKLFLITGFLGALTTFSAYSLDTFALLQTGKITAALTNILLNNALSITAAAIGYWVLR
ncbi:MAG: fluoride efflux transporter CrcB [bacterium]|nr:fluoride efflux transporter CrcB [bacterium]